MGSISFTPEQFEALLARMGNSATGPEVVRSSVISGPVGWADLPMLNSSDPAGIDGWFLAFEAKMKAGRVEATRWAERFEECPRVPQDIKTRLTPAALTDYAVARQWVLKEHGPLDPVGYFRAKIYAVKGEARDQVRKELQDLLVLYNRAAADFKGPTFTKRDLIYPFINAFPTEFSQLLAKDLGFALSHEDPFDQLYHRAPEAVSSGLTLLNQVQESLEQPTKRAKKAESTEDKLDYMMAQLAAMKERLPGGGERHWKADESACSGCGGSCPDREVCPARGRVCYNCQMVNHFASVCLKPRTQQRTPQNDRSRPFRRGPASHRPR